LITTETLSTLGSSVTYTISFDGFVQRQEIIYLQKRKREESTKYCFK
jgi:hypothetical protein